jgi:hypothetical protein
MPRATASPRTDGAPLSDAVAPAVYVNYFEVGHNPFEFLLDLGQFHPGATDCEGRVSIHTRIALAPPYAKMFSDLLARAVQEHEGEHGAIALIGEPANPFNIALGSLGEFEDRARALRSRDRGEVDAAVARLIQSSKAGDL